MVQYFKSHISLTLPTVDGSEIPNNHLECLKKTLVKKDGINYQPQLVSFPGFLPSVNCFSPPLLRS